MDERARFEHLFANTRRSLANHRRSDARASALHDRIAFARVLSVNGRETPAAGRRARLARRASSRR